MSRNSTQTAGKTGPERPTQAPQIGLVIPTLNAGGHLDRLLPALRSQTLRPARFLVIDSDSRDDTVRRFREAGAEVTVIAPESFDHGATRQMAVEMLTDVQIVIFLTQDAIPAHPEAFANLTAPFEDPDTGMVYGRQLPSPGAGPIGAHARLFNYPDQSHRRTIADAARYGIKTVFCSNSFAAYRRSALIEVGGFPKGTILGEDMLAAASLLRKGWSKCYAAEARVHHSHDYGPVEEFRRYFDIGVLHGTRSELLAGFGRPDRAGWRFLSSELRYLRTHAAHLIAASWLRTILKYGGYRLGRKARYLPRALNRRLGLNWRYWSNRRLGPETPEPEPGTAGKLQTGR